MTITVNVTQHLIKYQGKPEKRIQDNHAFHTALLAILIRKALREEEIERQ